MSSIFSKIIAGEIPSYKIYEDPKTFAFLTIEPHTKGHTLVIPKIEVDQWDDVPPEYYGHMWETAQFVAKILKEKLGCKRVGIMVAGFEVPHTHIHLIPIESEKDMMGPPYKATEEELKAVHVTLTT